MREMLAAKPRWGKPCGQGLKVGNKVVGVEGLWGLGSTTVLA